MKVMVNAQNVRSYLCKNCHDTVNFDNADELMKESHLCDKCLQEKIAEEG